MAWSHQQYPVDDDTTVSKYIRIIPLLTIYVLSIIVVSYPLNIHW